MSSASTPSVPTRTQPDRLGMRIGLRTPPGTSGEKTSTFSSAANVTPEYHWTRAYTDRQLGAHLAATERIADDTALIVWPENAVPRYLEREPMLAATLSDLAVRRHADLLVGAPRISDDGIRNSVRLITAAGRNGGYYDKQHLVAFAEDRPLVSASSDPNSPTDGEDDSRGNPDPTDITDDPGLGQPTPEPVGASYGFSGGNFAATIAGMELLKAKMTEVKATFDTSLPPVNAGFAAAVGWPVVPNAALAKLRAVFGTTMPGLSQTTEQHFSAAKSSASISWKSRGKSCVR